MKDYPIPTSQSLEKFWNKVDKTLGHGPQGTCWLWTRKGTEGYGLFWYQNRFIKPSRFSYLINFGPTDLWVLHRCDVRSCVNPEHLFAGTRKDNMEDCARKERVSTTKLNADQVREILASRMSHLQIARRFGVTKSNIARIKKGKTWKHIPRY